MTALGTDDRREKIHYLGGESEALEKGGCPGLSAPPLPKGPSLVPSSHSLITLANGLITP